ncbi:MAG: hypothetical protein QXM38_03480 [Candidatus Aenigmatarchaeota archaeon]
MSKIHYTLIKQKHIKEESGIKPISDPEIIKTFGGTIGLIDSITTFQIECNLTYKTIDLLASEMSLGIDLDVYFIERYVNGEFDKRSNACGIKW